MGKIIVIILSLLMMGCITWTTKKQTASFDPTASPRFIEEKEISIKVKVKENEQSLEDVVSDLNGIYGLPSLEINAFRSEVGETIVMKKLYYQIDRKSFIVVGIVNDRVMSIDTIHSPVLPEEKIINKEKE